jgi:hypothetical protein
MKNLNFEKIFKLIVLLQLTIILLLLIFSKDSDNSNSFVVPTENGRYDGIVIKNRSFNGREEEIIRVIDTKTGEILNP